MLIHEKSVTLLFILFCSGLKITADQRTMSGLIADLTGQTLVLPVILTGQTLILPVILTGHFWIQTFLFCCIALKPSKKKNATMNEFHVNEMQQSETLTN